MQVLPKAGWRYATLLIILFAIAALAVREILIFMEPPRIPDIENYRLLAVLLSALTFGFMLIASAFGLWAIRFSAEAESVKSVSTIVNAMDFIQDGVIALDRRGRITAANPTAPRIICKPLEPGLYVREAFPFLSENDLSALTRESGPHEVECEADIGGGHCTLRFRSQSTHGGVLILFNDVTAMSMERQRRRQNAYFQLLGHLARGIADDVNDMLCGISGHAAILLRDPTLPIHARNTVQALDAGAERGIRLAGHLMQLASADENTERIADTKADIEAAVALLSDNLDPEWSIHFDAPAQLPLTRLDGCQIEQVVYSVGLLTTEGSHDHALWIMACLAPNGVDLQIYVADEPLQGLSGRADLAFRAPDTEGILDTVVKTILDTVGGSLSLASPVPGQRIYRIDIPHQPIVQKPSLENNLLSLQTQKQLRGRQILVAGTHNDLVHHTENMRKAGLKVDSVNALGETLSTIEDREADTAGLLIQNTLLGESPDSLLRMLIRLCPKAGIVVLYPEGKDVPEHRQGPIQHATINGTTGNLCNILLDACAAADVQQARSA